MVDFEWHQFVKTGYNFTHNPVSMNLIWETDDYLLYVSEDDQTELWKYTKSTGSDVQVDVQAPGGGDPCNRFKDIQSGWHDRDNSTIWFIDCDQADPTIYIWKYNYATDTPAEVVSGDPMGPLTDVSAWDILKIGTDIFMSFSVDGISRTYIYEVDSAPWVSQDFDDNLGLKRTFGVVIGNKYYAVGDDQAGTCFVWEYDDPTTTITKLDTIAGYSYIKVDNQMGLSYDGDNNIYFVLEKDADSKNYLMKYSISGDEITELYEFNVCLMLDRNCIGTAGGPLEFEKGYEIDTSNIYQIHHKYNNLIKIQNLGLSDEWYFGSPDDINLEDVGTLGTDISFVDQVVQGKKSDTEIIDEWANHKNVLRLRNSTTAVAHSMTEATAGDIEFYAGTNNNAKTALYALLEADPSRYIILLYIKDGKFQYLDDAFQYQDVGVSVDNNTPYLIRFVWRADNTFDIYVNSVKKVDDQNTVQDQDGGADVFMVQNSTGGRSDFCYLDAFGNAADPDYSQGDNADPITEDILAITDNYVITDYPYNIYVLTEVISTFKKSTGALRCWDVPTGQFFLQNELSPNQAIEIYENDSGTRTLAFRGVAGRPKYQSNQRIFEFNCFNLGWDDLDQRISYSASAEGLDEVVLALIGQLVNPYIYADTTSIPNIAVSITYEFVDIPLREALYICCILGNAYFWIEPDGYLYFRIYSNSPASGDAYSQASRNMTKPYLEKLQTHFNDFSNIRGGWDPVNLKELEPTTPLISESILINGRFLWRGKKLFAGAESQTDLDAIITGLKAWEGMTSGPLEVSFYVNKYYYPVGYDCTLKFASIQALNFDSPGSFIIIENKIDFLRPGMDYITISNNITRKGSNEF